MFSALQIKVDLEAVAEKYCPGFNLKEEVEKGFITTDDDTKRTKRYRNLLLIKSTLKIFVS